MRQSRYYVYTRSCKTFKSKIILRRMKKYTFALMIYFTGTIISCCSDDGTITYNTVETASVLLFSFDDNGIFPYLDNYNPNELGIGIYADSLSTRIEIASNFSKMDKVYACTDPNQVYYTNTIDSLSVRTIYDFDNNHPAGSNIDDILLYLDHFGETFERNINEESSIVHNFKFSVVPQNDSLQFEISGRITNKGNFTKTTELIILE